MLFIPESPGVVKGEGREIPGLTSPGPGKEGRATASEIHASGSPSPAGGDPGKRPGKGEGRFTPPLSRGIYMTVKYDTRSAVPALLITRLVTA